MGRGLSSVDCAALAECGRCFAVIVYTLSPIETSGREPDDG